MGKSGGGSSTTVQKSDPWSGIQNYLTGGTTTTGGTKNPFTGEVTGGTTTTTTGLYPEAERLYNQSGWNPTMQGYNDQYVQTLASRSGQPQTYYDTANSALSGSFDPNITKVANIAGANNVTPSYMQGSSIQGVGNVNAAQSAGAPNLNAATWNNPALVNGASGQSGYVGDVTSNQAWGGLGSANPTSALSSLLSGKADTSALNSYMDSAMGRMRDNFQESVIPSIGRDAVSTGQYGSSRQGIAEGLAAKGLSQSMGDLASSMYNNAYNTAQSNMYGTANALSSLGLSNSQQNASREQANNQFNASNSLQGDLYNAGVLNNQGQFNANAANNMGQFNATNALNNNQFNANAANNMGQFNATNALGTQQFNASNDLNTQQFNANAGNNMGMYNTTNDLNTQQFNANIGNQNNTQELQRAAAALSNRQQGLNMIAGGNSMGDASYNQIISALQQPNNYNWNNLNNYSQIMSPSLGVGGSTSTSTPTSTNALASGMGGALAGAQLAGLLGTSTGWGTAMGAGLGLLSDRRFKTDIESMGKLDNGITVYRYRYKSGGPMMLGVMADEVKAVNPDAVITRDGVDYVNYGGL